MEYINGTSCCLQDIDKMSFSDIKLQIERLKVEYSNFNISEKKFMCFIKELNKDTRKNVQNLARVLLNYIEKRKAEIMRVKAMYEFDLRYAHKMFICGSDEVGRGPLAGPIVAASVILDLNDLRDTNLILGIKDSKKLTPKLREELSEIIKNKAVCYNIVELDNETIDKKGIGWCNNEVLKASALGLARRPNLVLSDGYKISDINIENEFVIKGDEKSASIACASIIAKVYRDNLMKNFSKIYSKYGFEDNSGYGTKDHIEAVKKYGPCPIHRLSFLNNILCNKN